MRKRRLPEKRGGRSACYLPFLELPLNSSNLSGFLSLHSGVVDHLRSSTVFFDKGVPVAAAAVVEGPVFLLFPFHFDELLVSALALGYGVGF